ncbi:aldo/keto reductase [Amnibacterium setariae]|uniref:Aldo/keto reductase n=1 Tax=Amnibacterium setariae TaxID=2306585 RepID=A0A3A1U1P3_9MICO|nr:aldo/keto reductase [Amnibacterium setariae]RIX28376.1 aldo/keto reductase [Amnibacterium setariae]
MRTTPVAGLDLTALTMGSAPLPTPVARAVDLLDEGWEAGIRALDAADGTGGAESAAGRWLEERQPEGVVVLSGLGTVVGQGRGADLSPARIDGHVAAAVRRLGRVDLGWLRGADAETPLEDTLQALAGAIEGGRLRAWGAGDVDAWALEGLLAEADRTALPRPAFVRVRLNLLERGALQDLAPLAAGEGVVLLAGAPLGGGRLTGRHVAAEESAAEAIRFGAPRDTPIDPALDALVALRDLARDLELSLEGLALAWLLATDPVASTIATPRAKADWDPVHEALERPLDAETVERLEHLLPQP